MEWYFKQIAIACKLNLNYIFKKVDLKKGNTVQSQTHTTSRHT